MRIAFRKRQLRRKLLLAEKISNKKLAGHLRLDLSGEPVTALLTHDAEARDCPQNTQ